MAKTILYIKSRLNLLSKINTKLSLQFQKAKIRIKLTIKDYSILNTKHINKRRVLDTK